VSKTMPRANVAKLAEGHRDAARADKRPQFQAMMDAACIDLSPLDVTVALGQSRLFREVAG
jgi:hypothetical protein